MRTADCAPNLAGYNAAVNLQWRVFRHALEIGELRDGDLRTLHGSSGALANSSIAASPTAQWREDHQDGVTSKTIYVASICVQNVLWNGIG